MVPSRDHHDVRKNVRGVRNSGGRIEEEAEFQAPNGEAARAADVSAAGFGSRLRASNCSSAVALLRSNITMPFRDARLGSSLVSPTAAPQFPSSGSAMAASRTKSSRNTPRARNQDVHEDFQKIDG